MTGKVDVVVIVVCVIGDRNGAFFLFATQTPLVYTDRGCPITNGMRECVSVEWFGVVVVIVVLVLVRDLYRPEDLLIGLEFVRRHLLGRLYVFGF